MVVLQATLEVAVVGENGHQSLPHGRHAVQVFGLQPRLAQRRNQQRGQHRDDRHHDEELDERKTVMGSSCHGQLL